MIRLQNPCVRRKEKGVALLFALGMLSLLMVMGLAFVSTSILAQRVAKNNSDRSQSRSLAKSAINRIAMSVMAYQKVASMAGTDGNSTLGFMPMDFSSVFSYAGASASAVSTNDGLLDDKDSNGNSLDTSKDGYAGKLSYFDEDGNQILHRQKNLQWVSLKDETGSSSARLIGRFAFRVLPAEGGLPLPYVMNGFRASQFDYRGHRIYGEGATGKSVDNKNERIPWLNRWGQDIDELFISNKDALSGGEDWANLFNKDKDCAIPASLDSFFNAYDEDYTQLKQKWETKKNESVGKMVRLDGRKWFSRWFSDGIAAAVENSERKNVDVGYRYSPTIDESWSDRNLSNTSATASKVKSYHRFNLGRENTTDEKDEWYTRLGDPDPNSPDAIDRLTKLGEEYKVGAQDDYSCTSATRANRGGIPALRLTGDTKGSFSFLEHRRKQIAANLNDYCDSDDIPTMEKDGDKVLYSGNEKTLYINEIGVGGIIYSKTDQGNNEYTSDPQIQVQLLNPGIVAELVDIYGQGKDGNVINANSDQYSFATKIFLSADVTITPTVKIQYKPNGKPPFRKTGELELGAIPKTITIGSATKPVEVKIPGTNAWTQNNSYWTGCAQNSTGSSEWQPIGLKDACESALHGRVPNGVYGSAVVISYTIKVNSIKFGISKMTLSTGDTDVDFVNAPDQDPGAISDINPATLKVTNGSGKTNSYLPFLIGRMEAKDPRQNLNINLASSTLAQCQGTDTFQESDWFFEPQVKFPLDSSGNQVELNLGTTSSTDHFMSIPGKLLPGTDTQNTFTTVVSLSAAQSNSASTNLFGKPSDPLASGTAVDDSIADREVATDPAWAGSKREEHLSTAYIRNAPMRSPWELGAIHRGAVWETLNIKKTTSGQAHSAKNWTSDGRKYSDGDGILLDQIKMAPYSRAMGKVNLNRMNKDFDLNKPKTYENTPSDNVIYAWMGRALLNNLRLGQNLQDFSQKILDKWPEKPDSSLFSETVADNVLNEIFQRDYLMSNRAEWLLETQLDKNLTKVFDAAQTQAGRTISGEKTDAEREEIIGKIINLLDTKSSLPSEFKAVVVAQNIKDIGGTSKGESVTKVFGEDGESTMKCKLGTFDVEKGEKVPYHYFDEITGEEKMMVTFSRDPETGRIAVKHTEYID